MIYAVDRTTTWTELDKYQKKVHGPGKYNPTDFDEKRVKPAKGTYTQKGERITFVEEAVHREKALPSMYNPISMDKIKTRPTQLVKMRAETDRELEMIKKKNKKDDSPSPVSYRYD